MKRSVARILKFFAALLIIFKVPNKIILMVQQNYFQICIQQNFRSLSKIFFSCTNFILIYFFNEIGIYRLLT